ncbi:MAG: arylamine N-acetyltransferase [Fibrobacterota bacterium]
MLPPQIQSALATLSRIPYENLSKVIKFHAEKDVHQSLRTPEELLRGHRQEGTGGTCFSLTWFLWKHLGAQGLPVYPVLCDRTYGKNTHCGVVLEWEGKKYLLDPGYLSFVPIELNEQGGSSVETVYNKIELLPEDTGRFRLQTVYGGETKARFTLKDAPVSGQELLHAWEGSFLKEAMNYPVVTLLKGDAHLYFQKETLYVRRKGGSEKFRVDKKAMPEALSKHFGISPEVTARARELFYG